MLISKFYSNNLINNKNKKSFSEYILNKINLTFLILFMICLYLFSNSNNLINSSKFEIFNEILVKNGFVIKNIEIKGKIHLNENEILKIISSYKNINIFSINIQKIYKEINNHSWVKEGTIEIVYPDTLKVFLTEKEPIAIWQNKFGNKLITKNGDIILEKNLNYFKKYLPIIIGENAHKNIYKILEILNLKKDFVKNVWSLTFVNERRWDLHFKQGLTIRLPSTNIKEAWQKVVSLNNNFNILNIGLTELDLRNPHQILGKIDVDKKLIFKKKKS